MTKKMSQLLRASTLVFRVTGSYLLGFLFSCALVYAVACVEWRWGCDFRSICCDQSIDQLCNIFAHSETSPKIRSIDQLYKFFAHSETSPKIRSIDQSMYIDWSISLNFLSNVLELLIIRSIDPSK